MKGFSSLSTIYFNSVLYSGLLLNEIKFAFFANHSSSVKIIDISRFLNGRAKLQLN